MAEDTSALRAAEISASSAKHAAWVAAATSIVAALASVVSIIWSGQLSAQATDRAAQRTADATVRTVALELSGETDKSRAEFLRSQRQKLYGEVISHELQLREREAAFATLILDPARAADLERDFPAINKNYGKARGVLDRDRFQVDILGSPPFRTAYAQLVQEHNNQSGVLYKLLDRFRKEGAQPAMGVPYWNQEGRIDQVRQMLMAHARVDMGNQ
jgi:hypothetical protein